MRIFIALDVDEAVRHRIARFMDGVRGFAPDARWVRPESLHITLKFIGTMVRNGQRMAALSDGTGNVDYAVEGGIIGGRFRVLKIGEQSIEMAYLDGRGRQTIRLTGS